jgi:hypothetical protein|tara:strand:+ start:281 stop:478 length:198 start_codon:yes stop_codon:yes gene_type:complete
MISSSLLRHHQIQAVLRDNVIPESELKYIGEIDGSHTYLIAGEHIAKVEDIIGFDQVDDTEGDPV